MRLRTFDVLMTSDLKPVKLNLYKGAQVLDFIDTATNQTVKLLIAEDISGDEFEDRVFCFYQANGGVDIPEGAKFIATCKDRNYWVPFALFEITGCVIEEG